VPFVSEPATVNSRATLNPLEWMLPPLLFGGLAAWLFRRLLLGGKAMVDLDIPNIHVPFRTFSASVIKDGQIPLWVPDLQFGLPYLANGDTAVLYPFQLPLLWMDAVNSIGALLWLQTVLTMMAMYAFLRLSLDLSVSASCLGAVIFGLNGFFLVRLGLLGLVYAQPWIPLLMLGIERAVNRSLVWAVLTGLALALSLLSGHPQQLYFSVPFILLFVAALAFKRRRPRLLSDLAMIALIALVVGLGSAAVQILPQAELVAHSARDEMPFEESTFGAVDGGRIWTILLPDFWRSYTGEVAGWVGLTGIFLAAAGMVTLFRGRQLVELSCWGAILLSSLILSVGGGTPVYRVILRLWPGLDSFRFPLRFLYFAVLAVSVLASYGFEAIRSNLPAASNRRHALAVVLALTGCYVLTNSFGTAWEDRRLLFIASGAAVLAVIVTALGRRWFRRQSVEALVLVAVTFELFSVGSFLSWNHPVPVEIYAPGPLRTYLAQNPGGRLASVYRESNFQTAPGALRAAQGNAALLTGAHSIEGFGGQWPTDGLRVLQNSFNDRIRQDDLAVIRRTNLFNLLGIEFVVGDHTQPNLASAGHLRPVAAEDGFTLYRALQVGPRVRAYCGAEFEESGRRIQETVLGEGFDVSLLSIRGKGADDPGGACGSARIIQQENARIDIDVTLPEDGWVFLADTWYPGWTAEVDGRKSAVENAQAFFRATRVPEGRHQVTFLYRPKSFQIGLAISIATLLGLVVVALILVRRNASGHRLPNPSPDET
jgi:hypothetical protein